MSPASVVAMRETTRATVVANDGANFAGFEAAVQAYPTNPIGVTLKSMTFYAPDAYDPADLPALSALS